MGGIHHGKHGFLVDVTHLRKKKIRRRKKKQL